MIAYDRLLGFNQSYRLIKALIDYKTNNNLSEKEKELYNAELKSFLDAITNEIDSRITIDIKKELNNIDKYGNGVLNNIFSSETKISKQARKHQLFEYLTKYIVNNNDIANDFNKIKEFFDDVKGSLDEKTDLTRYKDKYDPDVVKNISEELNKIAKYNSEKYGEINAIYNEILKGLDLMTSNEQNLSNYFETDLYFSLTHHIRVTNTIIKNLTDKKYNLLSQTLETLTNIKKNNNSGLFKDGI
jgi:hypothetical protein